MKIIRINTTIHAYYKSQWSKRYKNAQRNANGVKGTRMHRVLRSVIEYLRDRASAGSYKDLLVGDKPLITKFPHERSHILLFSEGGQKFDKSKIINKCSLWYCRHGFLQAYLSSSCNTSQEARLLGCMSTFYLQPSVTASESLQFHFNQRFPPGHHWLFQLNLKCDWGVQTMVHCRPGDYFQPSFHPVRMVTGGRD